MREKLESEWREELGLNEEDRLVSLRNYKDLQMRLDELDLKLQKYKIEDENLVTDRWSLDPRLFYKSNTMHFHQKLFVIIFDSGCFTLHLLIKL